MVLALALVVLSSSVPQSALATSHAIARDAGATRVTFAGRVVDPRGAPAEGATIVTSAGGEAIAAADGRFEIEVEMPLAATSLDLTATLPGGSLAACSTFVPGTFGPQHFVGTLVLTPAERDVARWRAQFGGLPGVEGTFSFGTSGTVNACAIFDDGGGPALYVGGDFTNAGGVAANHVACWDGTRWTSVGSGMGGTSAEVHALAVFDDGGGPALYAGGNFTTAGGVSANNIARWDGASWSRLGNGVSDAVRALVVFDDGGGPALYAGGEFPTAAGLGTAGSRIAKWNGTRWWGLLGGMSGTLAHVDALSVFDDGTGPALYAGGEFTHAGGVPAANVARWFGGSWTALGSGANLPVLTLATFDDGGGPALYAGGNFTTVGGASANHVARWDGATWSALGSGVEGEFNASAHALAAFDDGTGAALYVGGEFSSAGGADAASLARWDGGAWSPVGPGALEGPDGARPFVAALAVFDDGGGAALHVGGDFERAGGLGVKRIAKWDGASWSRLGRGLNSSVTALEVFDDGGGAALYAGGRFATAGGVAGATRIARWDGASWAPLGGGVDGGFPPSVGALEVFDDGGGPGLYAGGVFTTAGGSTVDHVARWDGASWSALGGGVAYPAGQASVDALLAFDDGSGVALYAGGQFTSAGGTPASSIARWNGSSWSALGSGISGPVDALAAFDDGSGPALYAGGNFTLAGGVSVGRIARWDGAGWSPLGSGVSGGFHTVHALAVFNDGSGPALYAGGEFTTAGGVPAEQIARWDGTSWSPVGLGLGGGGQPAVTALRAFDDGSGRALFAVGNFLTADGQAANRIARWNGTKWMALPGGLNDWGSVLCTFDDGEGPALYVGGRFDLGPKGDAYLAKWGRGIRSVHR